MRYRRPLVIALLSLSGLATVAPADAATHRPVVAPYLDVSVSGKYSLLYDAIRQDHLKNVTAAFVIGSGCTPIWDDSLPVANDPAVSHMIAKARSLGAHVIISLGGENGTELAQSCTSTTRLTKAYRSVIKRTHATQLDFDIEGAAVADPASIARRFAALHTLQRSDHKLRISLTLPVEPNGLDHNGRAVLRAARKAKVSIRLVNIMAMDYGSPTSPEMGNAAISAAKHTRVQLRKVWPHDGYANLGITPMIGQNDVANETFSLADAKRVTAFAKAHGVGRLAFWAMARDEPCGSGDGNYDCSNVPQSPLAFTKTFLG